MDNDSAQVLNGSDVYDDPEVARILGIKRRNESPSWPEIKRMLNILRPGMTRRANLERYGHGWRLRFSIRDENGGLVRKSLIIEEPWMEDVVRDYLNRARQNRREHRSELRIRELARQEDLGGRIDDTADLEDRAGYGALEQFQ